MKSQLSRSIGGIATAKQPSLPRSWAISGTLLGVLFATLLFAPAKWLGSAIALATEDRVLLLNARGTVWSGTGWLQLTGGAGSVGAVQLPNRIQWKLSPLWLGARIELLGSTPLAASVSFKHPTSVAWSISTPALNVPAELLTGLGAPWNTLELAGQMTLKTKLGEAYTGIWSQRLGSHGYAGLLTLDIEQLQTALSTVRPLGNYRLSLTGPQVILETIDPDAALQLVGGGNLGGGAGSAAINGVSRTTSFMGEATAAAGKEAVLSNLLHIIGQKKVTSDGRMRATLRLG
jgi:general secretion pathway protein N